MPTRPIPSRETFTELVFPFKGIDIAGPYSAQPPQTTPVGQNVRAFEAGSARKRGGSRPGLSKYVATRIFNISLIQELGVVVGVGYVPPGSS